MNVFHLTELTDDITKCCSACFNRIARRLGTNPQTNEPLVPLVPENSDGMYQGCHRCPRHRCIIISCISVITSTNLKYQYTVARQKEDRKNGLIYLEKWISSPFLNHFIGSTSPNFMSQIKIQTYHNIKKKLCIEYQIDKILYQ